MTLLLISLQGTILIYLLCGFILNKIGMMNASSNKFLSNLLTGFLLPINVFVSFVTSFTFDNLKSCMFILLLGLIFETSIFIFTHIKFKSFTNDQMAVARYDMLVSNGGLIGTPIIESLFGASGVLYANVFLIPQRIMIYSAGESIFNPKAKKTIKQIIKSIYTNRIIIAMIFGLILLGLNIKLPGFIYDALHSIAKCLSPISLMLVGSLLADKIKLSFIEIKKISIIILFRQIIFPVIVMIVVSFLPLDIIVKATMILLIGMPVGSTCAIYANKYGGNTGFASLSVFLSTITSMFTLVILMAMVEVLLV